LAILVTGGAGYIGSHTARALRRAGYDVIIYDNLSTGYARFADGFELINGDIGDVAKLKPVLRRVDAVIHFAAHAYVGESVENPRKYYHNNVVAGLNLLNALVEAELRRFVFSSTCAVYGMPAKVPIAEDTVRQPVNPYGATKLNFEYALEAYSRAYGFRYASLRYFNAAGADESGEIGELHDPETHLIPLALAATIPDTKAELKIFGTDYPTPDGTCIRDYIHVNDLADAHLKALEYLAQGGESVALNLGTGRGSSVNEIVQAVETATGRTVRTKTVPRRAGDPPELVANAAKAEKLLRWKAERKLDAIVASAWKWMQNSQNK
jgi:UDP-glucose-4-epimerase GalE